MLIKRRQRIRLLIVYRHRCLSRLRTKPQPLPTIQPPVRGMRHLQTNAKNHHQQEQAKKLLPLTNRAIRPMSPTPAFLRRYPARPELREPKIQIILKTILLANSMLSLMILVSAKHNKGHSPVVSRIPYGEWIYMRYRETMAWNITRSLSTETEKVRRGKYNEQRALMTERRRPTG